MWCLFYWTPTKPAALAKTLVEQSMSSSPGWASWEGDSSNKGTEAALMTPAICIHPSRTGCSQGMCSPPPCLTSLDGQQDGRLALQSVGGWVRGAWGPRRKGLGSPRWGWGELDPCCLVECSRMVQLPVWHLLLGAGPSLRSCVCMVPQCRCRGNINNKVKSHFSWGEVKRERKWGCYSASWLFLESKRECKGYCRICQSI